jgi:hypothetical protein
MAFAPIVKDVVIDPGTVLGTNGAKRTPVEVEYVYTTPLTVAVNTPFLAVYMGAVVQSFVIVPALLTK